MRQLINASHHLELPEFALINLEKISLVTQKTLSIVRETKERKLNEVKIMKSLSFGATLALALSVGLSVSPNVYALSRNAKTASSSSIPNSIAVAPKNNGTFVLLVMPR